MGRSESSAAPTSFRELPRYAAWEHCESRRGFEVVILRPPPHACADGATCAIEANEPWAVQYAISFDERWQARGALITGQSDCGRRVVKLQADTAGSWRVDGERAPELEGCVDVDLESSCLTNAFPVKRLGLTVGTTAVVPAVYVRARTLRAERLEQCYTRLDDVDGRQRYGYAALAFDFECELVYDETGLLLDYPGIGRRAA